MHVAIVNEYALPAGAPGITRHGDLGRELVRRGNRVTVIASPTHYLSRQQAHSGAEVHDGVTFRWVATGTYLANDSHRVRSMVTFMFKATWVGMRMRSRPDVVIGSSPQLLAGISALLVAWRFRVPFVFEVRDPWPSALVDLGAVRAGSMAHRLLLRVERFLYRRSKRIIAVMEHIDLRVAEVGEDASKCIQIPNASTIPPELGEVPADVSELVRGESGRGRTVLMYLGAHGLSNALHEVLEALDQLRSSAKDTYERVSIFFVGDGPAKVALRAENQQMGHEHVHFVDSLPKPSAIALMSHADWVLIHFAGAEFKRYGMSANKLFDAMATGRPVLLASPVTDTPVDRISCGIRYQPGSSASLAQAISEAVAVDPATRHEMGDRGLAEATERYNLRVTGAQLEALLTSLISDERGA